MFDKNKALKRLSNHKKPLISITETSKIIGLDIKATKELFNMDIIENREFNFDLYTTPSNLKEFIAETV